ncbi:MAG: DNA-3-methyladenine glycosylase [Clostridia bacterium]|nr:DNA-3-methyladenine glycosylase [Clostridia bacterium]
MNQNRGLDREDILHAILGAGLKPLPFSFYSRDTRTVACELLGTYMVRFSPEGTVCGRVVETEAYLGREDPACHSARGPTPRNAVMFGPAGRAYVYFIYGMYYCFNVTTEDEKTPAAVLLRALEPVAGIELMSRRRGTREIKKLCRGPGCLAQALGIDKEINGTSVVDGPVRFYPPLPHDLPGEIAVAPRVGITQAADWPLRYYLKGNPFVSRP